MFLTVGGRIPTRPLSSGIPRCRALSMRPPSDSSLAEIHARVHGFAQPTATAEPRCTGRSRCAVHEGGARTPPAPASVRGDGRNPRGGTGAPGEAAGTSSAGREPRNRFVASPRTTSVRAEPTATSSSARKPAPKTPTSARSPARASIASRSVLSMPTNRTSWIPTRMAASWSRPSPVTSERASLRRSRIASTARATSPIAT